MMIANVDKKTAGLRLSDEAIRVIRDVIASVFAAPAAVYVFGSRTNLQAKGGDIDLLVISNMPPEAMEKARIKTIAQLQMILGDQHFDVIATRDAKVDDRLVVKEALRKGIKL
jgi:predicted nucleotidyltransferase